MNNIGWTAYDVWRFWALVDFFAILNAWLQTNPHDKEEWGRRKALDQAAAELDKKYGCYAHTLAFRATNSERLIRQGQDNAEQLARMRSAA